MYIWMFTFLDVRFTIFTSVTSTAPFAILIVFCRFSWLCGYETFFRYFCVLMGGGCKLNWGFKLLNIRKEVMWISIEYIDNKNTKRRRENIFSKIINKAPGDQNFSNNYHNYFLQPKGCFSSFYLFCSLESQICNEQPQVFWYSPNNLSI